MGEIISRIWFLYLTFFKTILMVTNLDKFFYLSFNIFWRVLGLHNIEYANRRIVANEIDNPRNHPWQHQPDQNRENWWNDFNEDDLIFNEDDFNEWNNRPWDIYDFYDIINQLNYKFIIFSFVTIFNIIVIKFINNDYWLLYQELKYNNPIISELYFDKNKFKIYFYHLFNIISNDNYCKFINQRITFLHLSDKNNFNFIISENIDCFTYFSKKYNFDLINNSLNIENDFLKVISDFKNLESDLCLNKDDFFVIRMEALKELIFLKNCFDEFEKNFTMELKQLDQLNTSSKIILFNIFFNFLISFWSSKNLIF